jgi:hypothetical protein
MTNAERRSYREHNLNDFTQSQANCGGSPQTFPLSLVDLEYVASILNNGLTGDETRGI